MFLWVKMKSISLNGFKEVLRKAFCLKARGLRETYQIVTGRGRSNIKQVRSKF